MNNVLKIKKYLIENNYDALIVSHGDIFFNEYVDEKNNFIRYATNFNGSAGFLIVYKNNCTLFVDGRYTIEAKNTVDKNINIKNFSFDDIKNDIENICGKNKNIIFDIEYFSYDNFQKFSQIDGIKIVGIEKLYTTLQKTFSDYFKDKKYIKVDDYLSKKSFIDKFNEIKKQVNSDYYIISDTANLSWVCGIRGFDIDNNPTINGFGILDMSCGIINVYTSKINCENIKNINSNIFFKDIKYFYDDLKKIEGSIHVNFAKINYKTFQSLRCENIENNIDVIDYIKCIKDEVEIENIKKVHIEDGVTMVKFLSYVSSSDSNDLDELNLQIKLNKIRQEANGFVMNSFETISAVNSNGAICHYKVSKKTNKKFSKNNVYLVDSGSHYFGGTTDITRTVFKGEYTDAYNDIAKAYTLVLKAMINISKLRFKDKMKGMDLDKLGRNFLQQNGLDFNHSIGHGVGCFLNVHEGPFSISPRENKYIPNNILLSNEPGYYCEKSIENIDGYGIRIENLIYLCMDENGYFFETITYCPIDKTLIDKTLLSIDEIHWFNNYHKNVFEKIGQKQRYKEEEYEWLKKACMPI